MHTRDYVALATAIRATVDRATDAVTAWEIERPDDYLVGVYYTARAVALVLAADNPRFDHGAFITACNFPDWVLDFEPPVV